VLTLGPFRPDSAEPPKDNLFINGKGGNDMSIKTRKVGEGKSELHPEHLADLEKSGLTGRTIKQAGIRTVRLADVVKVLGFNIPALASMYEIPYSADFSRFRAFYKDGGGKNPKYLFLLNVKY